MLTGSNYNFGELPPATVSGSVYIDANDDGVRQLGETGITGVPVELQGTDDLGAPITQFTNTNGLGNYSFAGLRPGSYFITEPTQPAGFFDGLENQGNTAAGVIAGHRNDLHDPRHQHRPQQRHRRPRHGHSVRGDHQRHLDSQLLGRFERPHQRRRQHQRQRQPGDRRHRDLHPRRPDPRNVRAWHRAGFLDSEATGNA